MNGAAKNLVEKFNAEGLPTAKVAAIFNGSDLAFSNRDCWNHLRNVRRNNLDVGDAQAVLNYCKQKQAQNSNFFYAIQCDDDDRMINFCWLDARSRAAYQYFGDVITFDTTYRTNKYSMPFAPFTGLNHHLQSILFGCALLQDESEKSFVWLFETWLEAMNEKKPVSIITDQDLAIGAAVAKVFPEARHHLCLWHIRKKFPEKLAHIYHKNSTFKRDLKRCIRESPTAKDFDEDWQRIIVDYKLQENEWLKRLFEIRESWVPVYNISTFFAGMNTTQRSECINSFFESFVNATTTLRDFVIKFEKAINNRYEAEKREDFESRHKSRSLSIGSKIEEHAASIYTRNVFGKFHVELASVSHYIKEKIEKNGSQYKYRVSNCFNAQDSFIVDIDLESKNATYGCQLFEFMGILCRHILAIFQAKNVVQIPSQYILRRWTKEANQYIEVVHNDIANQNSNVLRSIHLQRQFNQCTDLAKRSEHTYRFIAAELDRVINMATAMEEEMLYVNEALEETNQQNLICDRAYDDSSFNIKDPNMSQTKGRRRFKSGLELSINKSAVKRRACKSCGEYGHYQSTCKQKNNLVLKHRSLRRAKLVVKKYFGA
ncbi:protein FAR1-RELATED SEQUENCE 5-like [Gastrolobium bilobum]|uniref:protein FAR1-RELATED SEQUENCE 5-like n=1 Tax=Gastrolobium bilobum TaxID=150636 RepID=UPI002AB300AA|nr:protein FAR1-RELATED SEQUENCE 5-like [Gastrolobium bilobum]